MHDFVTPCTSYLENTGSLIYTVLPNVDLFIIQLQDITFINATAEFTKKEKEVMYWETVEL